MLDHPLVCLVCLEIMAVKDFILRGNWVGSKLAHTKKNLSGHF